MLGRGRQYVSLIIDLRQLPLAKSLSSRLSSVTPVVIQSETYAHWYLTHRFREE